MAGAAAGMKAIIVGGGIGGLTTAVALRRIGAEVLVLERAASPEHVQRGAGLHLWSNALRALQLIDVADEVAAIGTTMTAQRYLTWQGRPMGSLRVDALSRAVGAPTVGVSRPLLHDLLAKAAGEDVLRFGAECTGFEQGRGGVTVRLADGSQERGDLLVGADGIGSVVRRQLHGYAEPRYAGYTAWRALTDFAHPRVPVGEMWIHWGRGARILHYHVSDGRVYWLALVRAPEGGRDPAGGHRDAVVAHYRGWSEPIEQLLLSTDEAAISRMDVVDRDPVGHWGTGRVTLLGDAAHPMTPNLAQGAGQAIEDAVGLAGSLRRSGEVVAALRDYEQRRVKRANGFVDVSRTIGRMSLLRAVPLCAVRDRVVLPSIYSIYPIVKARKDLTPVL